MLSTIYAGLIFPKKADTTTPGTGGGGGEGIASLLTGTDLIPSNSLGVDGQFYIGKSTDAGAFGAILYHKESGAWVEVSRQGAPPPIVASNNVLRAVDVPSEVVALGAPWAPTLAATLDGPTTWAFDVNSTSPDDDDRVIKPNSIADEDPGRWLQTGPNPGDTTIYWGLGEVTVYNPSNFNSWDNDTLNNFILGLSSEVGPYRSGSGYPIQITEAGNFQAWLVVPDSYANPAATTGFQYGVGVVGSPTDNLALSSTVNAYPSSPGATFTNGFVPLGSAIPVPTQDGDTTVNGWTYFLRFYHGTLYRFYPIGSYITFSYGVPGNLLTHERTSNVATVTQDAPFLPSVGNTAWIAVSDAGSSSFDTDSVGTTDGTGIPWTYANTGGDVGSVATTGTIDFQFRGATIFLADITLFVFPE